MASDRSSVRTQLKGMNDELRDSFKAKRRVLSFAEYLELAEESPRVQLRSSPQLTKDCFDYWGTKDVTYPWGSVRRFTLFDCPWSDERDNLVGHETVQNHVYRALCEGFTKAPARDRAFP